MSGTKTTDNFDYAGPLTETVQLGNVATRVPGITLEWDAAALRIANSPEADRLLTQKYRDGLDEGAVLGMLESYGVAGNAMTARAQGAFMTQTVVGSPATCAAKIEALHPARTYTGPSGQPPAAAPQSVKPAAAPAASPPASSRPASLSSAPASSSGIARSAGASSKPAVKPVAASSAPKRPKPVNPDDTPGGNRQ